MAEEAHDSPAPDTDAKEVTELTVTEDIESRITTAMRSRVGHFKEQADSLTFEGVRRLLEKDLGLETFALDVHKRFVKQCLLKCLEGGNDDDASKTSGETVEKNESAINDGTESPRGRKLKKDVKEACSEDDKLEDSPVLGLLTGQKTKKLETAETENRENRENEEVSESTIKKAIRKRAAYVKANSDNVTMAGLRRLLEEDLKLDKNALDPYKKFITEQLDEALKSDQVSKPASEVKRKNLKNNTLGKPFKRSSKKVISTSSGSESEEEEEEEEEEEDGEEEEDEEEKPKKKITSKGKIKHSEGLKKRKLPKKEAEMPSKKRSKHAELVSEDNSDGEDSGSASDDAHSRSSAAKRKETSMPVYGKRVEHLKSVIKSCGMSVPPVIYKKVKQVPENKREAQLIKELEEILSKERLSTNPSEKEIKEVRKRKERAKELEGIDTSNIVSSSRRRSTTSFVAPPKPKIPELSDEDESEESDEDEDEDNDDEDGGDEGNSQSEESDEEEDEDSD